MGATSLYICLCAGVTDTAINKAIDSGHLTLKSIKQATGAMAQCCKCCGDCKEILVARTTYDLVDEEIIVCHT